jgi:alpha-amylase
MKNPFVLLLITILFFNCKKNDTPTLVEVTPPLVVDSSLLAFGTPFTGIPATKDLVMYEVNMRAFSSEGNFKGVQARLDSVKALGINVLWLMPIHPVGVLKSVGQLGSPYSVKNYKEVNPEFGTLEDLQTLVKEAHNRNMAVIIDWVANHTAWDNPWISSNPDWYTRDGAGTILIPGGTNWQDVADLNFSNAAMRLSMISAMKHWILKANIDGFRCDYADGVPYDFWKQALDSVKTLPNRKLILLAEGSRSDHFGAGFQMNYGWDYYGQLKNVYKNNLSAATLISSHNGEYNKIPNDAFKLRFTTNHDESAWDNSPIALFGGNAGAMSAFVLSNFVGGVPLLYDGQEVGRADKTPFFSRSAINWSQNPGILQEYKRLLAFRQSSNAIKEGALESFSDANVVAFKKTFQTQEVLVFVNVRNSISTHSLSTTLVNTSWKNALDNAPINLTTQLTLQPYQYLILKK